MTGAAPRGPPHPHHSSGTILLVEDHEGTRRVVERTLGSHGYQVMSASGANDALVLVQAHPGAIDLLILDVLLWGMTGAELFGRVRQVHRSVRVLYISGYSEKVLQQHGLSPNTATILRKPFAPRALLDKVSEALS